ncbi:MAG TPA: SH3 domain-containing protein [Usitatibacteraceae bacterium]|nr:SH3 domain-containing protein [Usitatibacteraceae bacterium]
MRLLKPALPDAAHAWAAFCFLAFLGAPLPLTAQQAPSTGAVAAPAAQPSYVSVGDRPAVLFDAPSQKGVKLFVLSRLQPLEVLVRLHQWTKVRDIEGAIGWIENSALGERRHVIATSPGAQVRAAASAGAAVVFDVDQRVLLEVVGPALEGWIPVAHRDGQRGYVRAGQVWGL